MNKLDLRNTCTLLAGAAASLLLATSMPADAATGNLHNARVTQVTSAGTDNGVGSQTIIINAATATQALTFVTSTAVGGACNVHSQNAETIKTMTSIAQAALLSGKRASIWYNTCAGFNYVVRVDILSP